MNARLLLTLLVSCCFVGCRNEDTEPKGATKPEAAQVNGADTAKQPATSATSLPSATTATTGAPAPPSTAVVASTKVPQRSVADRHRHLHSERGPDLPQHDDEITDVAFSPDGRMIATVGKDLKLNISHADTHALIQAVTLAAPTVKHDYYGVQPGVAFAPHGNQVAVAIGNELRLFDANSGQLQRALTDAAATGHVIFRQPAYSPGGRWLLGDNVFGNELIVWSTADQRLSQRLKPAMTTFAFAPDDRSIFYAVAENAIEQFDLAAGKVIHRFKGAHNERVRKLAVDPTGTLLAASDDGRRLVIYDLASRVERFRIDDWGHPDDMLFTADGLLLTESGSLYLVGAKELHDLGECRMDYPDGIAASPDGRQLLAFGRGDGRQAEAYRLAWSLEERTPIAIDAGLFALAIADDGKLLAVANSDYDSEKSKHTTTMALYSVDQTQPIATTVFDLGVNYSRNLDVAPDGKRLAACDSENVQIFSLPDLKPGPRWTPGEYSIEGCVFAPDGKQVLVIERYGCRLLDATTGKIGDAELEIQAEAARFTTGEKPLLFTHKDSEMHVYSWPEAKEVATWHAGPPIMTFAVSPDAKPYGHVRGKFAARGDLGRSFRKGDR